MAIPTLIGLKSNVMSMTENKTIIKPLIDDQFWFELSKEVIKSNTSRTNEAAAKLQQMIVWLWGIYTASAAVGIALSKTSYTLLVIILIASPSSILIFAYWFALWVQMPTKYQFDTQIPAEIKDAHQKGVKTRRRKLICAIVLSLFAAVLVSLALFAASFSKQSVSAYLEAYHQSFQHQDIIVVAGHFPADTKIILRISPVPHSPVPGTSKELLHVTPRSGELQMNIKLDFTAEKYDVEVEWQETDGLVRSLKRTVIPSKNKD